MLSTKQCTTYIDMQTSTHHSLSMISWRKYSNMHPSANLFLLLLASAATLAQREAIYDSCSSAPDSCLGFPSGCQDTLDCQLVAAWSPSEDGSDLLVFEAQAEFDGVSDGVSYVAAGFSSTPETAGTASVLSSQGIVPQVSALFWYPSSGGETEGVADPPELEAEALSLGPDFLYARHDGLSLLFFSCSCCYTVAVVAGVITF